MKANFLGKRLNYFLLETALFAIAANEGPPHRNKRLTHELDFVHDYNKILFITTKSMGYTDLIFSSHGGAMAHH